MGSLRLSRRLERELFVSFSDEFNIAMLRLVRDMNSPFGGAEYVTLCRETAFVWTLMGSEGCEFAEVRLLSMSKFEIEVILRYQFTLRWMIRRRASLHGNLVSAFAAVAIKRNSESRDHKTRKRIRGGLVPRGGDPIAAVVVVGSDAAWCDCEEISSSA